ncbi:hypothetical protein MKW98_000208 [Papaver atlanticum]|uniref:Uncharacterized protein n=1 Tax=Papaver atlanticum TaxID=357466 RepID=A0AAD4SRU0_9MAGN|nr:hypothetical protein MKW98_000208 [Papaver atlanticum]
MKCRFEPVTVTSLAITQPLRLQPNWHKKSQIWLSNLTTLRLLLAAIGYKLQRILIFQPNSLFLLSRFHFPVNPLRLSLESELLKVKSRSRLSPNLSRYNLGYKEVFSKAHSAAFSISPKFLALLTKEETHCGYNLGGKIEPSTVTECFSGVHLSHPVVTGIIYYLA